MKTRTRRPPSASATARLPSIARFKASAPSSDRKPKSKSDAKKCRVSTASGLSRTSGSLDRVDDLARQGRELRLHGGAYECLLQRIRPVAREIGHAPLHDDSS